MMANMRPAPANALETRAKKTSLNKLRSDFLGFCMRITKKDMAMKPVTRRLKEKVPNLLGSTGG